MKKTTTSQFDYPSSDVQGFKKYQPEKTTSLTQTEYQKERYKAYLKEQQEIERKKVKQEQSRKKQQERLHNKHKIQQQLENKKKQLQQLEKAKKQALEEEKRSYQLATIKQQQDQIRKIEQQQRMKDYNENANARFIDALRRMEEEKQERDIKKIQAQYRRKVVQQTQKVQRGKAIQYKNYIEEKQKNIQPQIKIGFDQYKQTIGRIAYNKNVDYTKTRMHNPTIIVQNQNQSPNANQQAEYVENVKRESMMKKKQQANQMRRKSQERGKQALLQLQRQKQYQEYCREAQEKAKLYNIGRIQAGKMNQYVGIKPSTLQQMEINKKIRSQQQFQKLFLGKTNPQWIGKKATKHDIIQARTYTNLPSQSLLNNYVRNPKDDSEIPGVSVGKYSFESDRINELTSVKKNKLNDYSQMPKSNIEQEQHSLQQQPRKFQQELQRGISNKLKKDTKLIQQNQQSERDSLDAEKQNKRQIVYQNNGENLRNGQLKVKKKGEEDLNYSQSQESFV